MYIYVYEGFFVQVVAGKVIRGLMFSRWITVVEEMVENFMGNRMSTVYDRDFEKLTRSSVGTKICLKDDVIFEFRIVNSAELRTYRHCSRN